MNLKHSSLAIALFAGALALSACSGDNNDMGPPDTGMVVTNPDTGPVVTDQDAGFPDTGRRDTGVQVPCPAGNEGCTCRPDNDAGVRSQGTCNDPSNVCMQHNDTVYTCVKPCTADDECDETGRANKLCRQATPADPQLKICVAEERKDDETCRGHSLGAAGRKIQGCREGARCLPLMGDEAGTGQCIQLCSPTAVDPSGGCRAPVPYCNPNLLTVGGRPTGICSVGKLGYGARCGSARARKLTQQCDSAGTVGLLNCISNDLFQQGPWISLPATEGFCVELCFPGPAATCISTTDPMLGRGVCKPVGGSFQGMPLGICSQECSSYYAAPSKPDNCTGNGAGSGTRCFPLPGLSFDGMTTANVSMCLNVLTPTIAEARVNNDMGIPRPVQGTTLPDCRGTAGTDGEFWKCTRGTVCENLGTPSRPAFTCIRPCTLTSTTSSTAPMRRECARGTNPNTVCTPFTDTSTTSPVGFCAEP